MFVSEAENFGDFGNVQLLAWHEVNVPYAVWTPASVRYCLFNYQPSEVNFECPIIPTLEGEITLLVTFDILAGSYAGKKHALISGFIVSWRE